MWSVKSASDYQGTVSKETHSILTWLITWDVTWIVQRSYLRSHHKLYSQSNGRQAGAHQLIPHVWTHSTVKTLEQIRHRTYTDHRCQKLPPATCVCALKCWRYFQIQQTWNPGLLCKMNKKFWGVVKPSTDFIKMFLNRTFSIFTQ
jgi:hypothetical protein